MKKVIGLLVASVLVSAFVVGCGKGAEEGDNGATGKTAGTPAPAPENKMGSSETAGATAGGATAGAPGSGTTGTTPSAPAGGTAGTPAAPSTGGTPDAAGSTAGK